MKKLFFVILTGAVIWGLAFIADILDWPYHPATQHDAQIIRLTSEIMANSDWNKKDTRDCIENAETMSLYCAIKKASIQVSGHWHHESNVMNAVRTAIVDTYPDNEYWHLLQDFNNAEEIGIVELRSVLASAKNIVVQQWQDRDSLEQRFYRLWHQKKKLKTDLMLREQTLKK